MVLGYKELDKNVDIKGVIVNNVKTKSHYEIIKKAIETYCMFLVFCQYMMAS